MSEAIDTRIAPVNAQGKRSVSQTALAQSLLLLSQRLHSEIERNGKSGGAIGNTAFSQSDESATARETVVKAVCVAKPADGGVS